MGEYIRHLLAPFLPSQKMSALALLCHPYYSVVMNRTSIARWGIRILPLVYMGLIWFLSGRPSDAVFHLGAYDGIIKESLHLIEFAILYVLWVFALLTWGPLSRRLDRFAVLMAVAYGCLDELHQYFVPSRSAAFIDMVKDVLGVCVAWFIIHRTYFRYEYTKTGRFLHWITLTFSPVSHDSPVESDEGDKEESL